MFERSTFVCAVAGVLVFLATCGNAQQPTKRAPCPTVIAKADQVMSGYRSTISWADHDTIRTPETRVAYFLVLSDSTVKEVTIAEYVRTNIHDTVKCATP